METREIVEAMVRAINSGRAHKVTEAMTSDGIFIGPLGKRIEGKPDLSEAFGAYFRVIPDYRIEFDGMITDGLAALLWGYSGGTVHKDQLPCGSWRGPAAWRAHTDGRRVREWQVYADTQMLRALLERAYGKQPLLQLEPG